MSDVEVKLSAQLARFADDERSFTVRSGTFGEVLAQIHARHPALTRRLVDESGAALPFVNIYVGGDNVRDLPSRDFTVPPEADILIMTAVAGG